MKKHFSTIFSMLALLAIQIPSLLIPAIAEAENPEVIPIEVLEVVAVSPETEGAASPLLSNPDDDEILGETEIALLLDVVKNRGGWMMIMSVAILILIVLKRSGKVTNQILASIITILATTGLGVLHHLVANAEATYELIYVAAKISIPAILAMFMTSPKRVEPPPKTAD